MCCATVIQKPLLSSGFTAAEIVVLMLLRENSEGTEQWSKSLIRGSDTPQQKNRLCHTASLVLVCKYGDYISPLTAIRPLCLPQEEHCQERGVLSLETYSQDSVCCRQLEDTGKVLQGKANIWSQFELTQLLSHYHLLIISCLGDFELVHLQSTTTTLFTFCLGWGLNQQS